MPAPGSHRLRIAVPGERHVWCNLVLGASCSCEVPSVFEVETPIVSELGFWDLRLPWNQFCSDFLVAISCFYDWVKVHCWVWWCCGVCYSRLKKLRFIQVLCHLQLVHSCRQAPTVFNVASLVYLSCPLVELAAATWWQQSVLWSSVAVVVLGTLAFAMVAFWGIPSSSHLYRSDRAGWKFWQLKLQDLKIFRKMQEVILGWRSCH